MRTHDVRKFRAVGARLDWLDIARRMLRAGHGEGIDDALLERLKERGPDTRLAWGCSEDLGVPRDAFTVWGRPVRDRRLRDTELVGVPVDEGELVWWGGEEAAHVQVRCQVQDPARPVALFLLRTGLDPAGAVGTAAVAPAGSPTVTLTASAGAATHAVLVNAHALAVRIQTVQDVVDADDWQPLERVGLPVDGHELGEYVPDEQGLVVAPTAPTKAAAQRIDRAGVPLGWYPVTETGRTAPPWKHSDPDGLVEETRKFLLPELRPLYASGTGETDQHALEDRRAVDPPSRADGTAADQPATARLKPLALLLLAAGTDPAANLATGFGTAYRAADLAELMPDQRGELEYLVTGHYRRSVLGDGVEVAAYIPPVQRHAVVPPVVDLRAARAALLPPALPDGPFHEAIEVSWRPGPRLATMTGPVAHAFAGWRHGAGSAEDLMPERLLGGSQPRAIPRPDADDATLAGGDRPKVVQGDQELPVDGAIDRGYGVAQCDIFGVWSRWEDVELTTSSPGVAPPRLAHLGLVATYAGSPVCPSVLTADLATEWTQRTPAAIELRAVFYPMPTGATPPPFGAPPPLPPPAPNLGLDSTLTFTGDTATATAGTVVPLREDGSVAPSWGAPEQGGEARSYRFTVPGPGLDFGAVSRWGVRVWARQTAPGIATPSVWVPVPAQPATAVAGSPVPAVPTPPPLPPGVPLGSTPDAQGVSHVKVGWSGLAGPHVDRVIVWEASETTLRQRLAPGSPPDRTLLPGVRLQQLWDLYDAAPAAQRPLGFRRAAEVPAVPPAADLTLARGSEDIHLFLVTAVTTTGVESPWPGPGGGLPAHAHLQAAAAPRLRRPAMPLVRPAVQPDGSLTVAIEAASPIPVTAFEVFATRSELAARDHLTMGPPLAQVPAGAAFDPVTADPRLDPITRQRVWTADWSGALPPSWEPWHLRAVAVPERTVPVSAVRGVVSPASDVVTAVVLPSAAPQLDPLVAEVVGADHAGLLIRTGTSAPDRVVPAGSHTVQVTLGAVTGPVQPLEAAARVADESTAPDTTAGPVVQRLPREAGRTPLLVWGRRDDPSVPVQATVRVADPLGRVAEQTLLIPGWVEPRPELTLKIIDVFRIAGRGYVASLLTSADPATEPPHVLTVVATLPGTIPPGPLRRRSLRASWELPDIPTRRSPVPPRGAEITAVRSRGSQGTEIGLWIPAARITGLTAAITHPIEGEVQDGWHPA